jgi:hypothetical protein
MTRYERIDFSFKPEKEEKDYYLEIDNAHRGLMANIDRILQITFPTRQYKRKTQSNRRLSEKMRARNEIVKKIMKEQKLRLGQASKYVKEHCLWS